MSKRPNPTPAKQQVVATPAPAIEDDDVQIVAKASRSGGGAIDQVRKHLVSHPEASLDDLKAMLSAAGLKCADGTLKTTRMQTLAILRFVRAKAAGEKVTSIEGSVDAIRYYVVQHPQASVEQITAWLQSKGAQSTPAAVKSSRMQTLAVLDIAA
jgi:hypothetical protein